MPKRLKGSLHPGLVGLVDISFGDVLGCPSQRRHQGLLSSFWTPDISRSIKRMPHTDISRLLRTTSAIPCRSEEHVGPYQDVEATSAGNFLEAAAAAVTMQILTCLTIAATCYDSPAFCSKRRAYPQHGHSLALVVGHRRSFERPFSDYVDDAQFISRTSGVAMQKPCKPTAKTTLKV